ncbi:hypothetical protein [Nonomuraea basaltis]|nr:hypothetical protein [Nonomuraea basaltis]
MGSLIAAAGVIFATTQPAPAVQPAHGHTPSELSVGLSEAEIGLGGHPT